MSRKPSLTSSNICQYESNVLLLLRTTISGQDVCTKSISRSIFSRVRQLHVYIDTPTDTDDVAATDANIMSACVGMNVSMMPTRSMANRDVCA